MDRELKVEQMLFIKIIKGKDAKKRPFTAYVLLTQAQKDVLEQNHKAKLNTYEIFYQKLGDISTELHNEIMLFFALKYLDRPLRYIVHDLPLDKPFFTEEDFIEKEPVLIQEFQAKYLRVMPEKLFSNIITIKEENLRICSTPVFTSSSTKALDEGIQEAYGSSIESILNFDSDINFNVEKRKICLELTINEDNLDQNPLLSESLAGFASIYYGRINSRDDINAKIGKTPEIVFQFKLMLTLIPKELIACIYQLRKAYLMEEERTEQFFKRLFTPIDGFNLKKYVYLSQFKSW